MSLIGLNTVAQCEELLGISDGVTPHPERLARQIAPRFIDILAQVEVNIEESLSTTAS